LDGKPTALTSDRVDMAFRNGRMKDGQIIAKQLIGHFFCYLRRQHLPSPIRDLVDFMTSHILALDLHCPSNFSTAGACRAPEPLDW
jgi:hypothetical protein